MLKPIGDSAPRVNFNRHARFCQRYGNQPNLVAYDMGRERGLADFCAGGDDTRAISNSARYSQACTRANEDPLANPTVVGNNISNLGIERTNLLRNIQPF